MNWRKTITVGFPAILILAGCSAQPECSDNGTVELVERIALDRIRDSLTNLYSPYADPLTYSFIKQQIDQGASQLRHVVEKVDTDAARMKISLSGIRTLESDNPRQSRCAADLAVIGPQGSHSSPIEYSAQRSDAGDTLHVEVKGL